MKQFHVGEVIRECRQHRGVTQAQLCEGICDTVTMSRIENGKQQPRRAILILLLQRLGVAEEQYHGLCSFDDLALEELKLAIRNANARFDYRVALELLDRLVGEHDCQNPIMRQFILWTQAINGRLAYGEVVPYALDERLALLTQAIRCTAPSLDLGDIASSLLGLDEIKIILSIANAHCNMGHNDDAVMLYRKLLTFIENSCMDFSEKPFLIAIITYNYSRILGVLEQYEEELAIAEIGIKYSIDAGRSIMLGKLMMNKACALDKLGRPDEGKEYSIRAYYLLKSMNMDEHVNLIQSYLKENHEWIPS